MENFEKEAKRAAHKHAMLSIVSPFTHKEAVKDTEESFLVGVYAIRENINKTVETKKRGLTVDEVLEQAFAQHVSECYNGEENNKDLLDCIKNDIFKGIEWYLMKGCDEDE